MIVVDSVSCYGVIQYSTDISESNCKGAVSVQRIDIKFYDYNTKRFQTEVN